MLGKIRQIAVSVKDLDVSTAFYRDKLGLKLLFQAPPGLSFFDIDGVWLMLSKESEREPAQPGSVLYFDVRDIKAVHAELAQRGVEFADKPHCVVDMGTYELWINSFKDPDGTLLALREEVAK